MVWLLPVPGGPMMTMSRPSPAATTAASCELSAGSGAKSSAGLTRRSTSSARGRAGSSGRRNGSSGPSIRWPTRRLVRRSAVRSTRSFHMRYLAKEKVENAVSSTTSKPAASRTSRRTRSNTRATSRPASSRGSSSLRSGASIPCSASFSRSVRLKRSSSPPCASVKGEAAERRRSSTGSSRSGARWLRASDFDCFQRRKPTARKSVLVPVSARSLRARRKSAVSRASISRRGKGLQSSPRPSASATKRAWRSPPVSRRRCSSSRPISGLSSGRLATRNARPCASPSSSAGTSSQRNGSDALVSR